MKAENCNWNDQNIITIDEIVDFLLDKPLEDTTWEIAKKKASSCSQSRIEAIVRRLNKKNTINANNQAKEIIRGKFNNDSIHLEGLHTQLYPYGEHFLPQVGCEWLWLSNEHITSPVEAMVVKRAIFEVESNLDGFKQQFADMKRKTNQQKRNKTTHITNKEWTEYNKERIQDQLIKDGTPKTKAKIIATKTVSLIKKIINS